MHIEDNILMTYNDVLKKAPKWLQLMDLETLPDFTDWIVRDKVTILAFEEGYIFLDEYLPKVRVTMHPCFTSRAIPTLEVLQSLVDETFRICDIHRLQIRVTEVAGRMIRNRLKQLSFVKEALLQNYTLDRTVIPNRLISAEIWSILK